MNSDKKLFKLMALLILMPLALAVFGGDRFRYPCQDPKNWDKDICKAPACEVTKTCPEYIFNEGAPAMPEQSMMSLDRGCR